MGITGRALSWFGSWVYIWGVKASSLFGPLPALHWGLPRIGAGTTALIHIYDLAEAIHPLTWFYFITVVQVTPSCLFTQTKSASD